MIRYTNKNAGNSNKKTNYDCLLVNLETCFIKYLSSSCFFSYNSIHFSDWINGRCGSCKITKVSKIYENRHRLLLSLINSL